MGQTEKSMNYYVFLQRQFPSLVSSYHVDVSSSVDKCVFNKLLALQKRGEMP